MLYLTCTTITSIDLAHYGVSRAKDWVFVKCITNTRYTENIGLLQVRSFWRLVLNNFIIVINDINSSHEFSWFLLWEISNVSSPSFINDS